MVSNDRITPIGVVHSVLKNLEDCPLQEHEADPEAIIEIFDQYLDAASHICPYSEIILLTWLDQADRSILKIKPRNDPNALLTGVFSTRSPDRPNPIGIHFVKVLSIFAMGKLKVEGLEVLDQTPVVDIKAQMIRE